MSEPATRSRPAMPMAGAAAAAPAIGIAGLLLVAGSLIGYQNQTSAEQAHVNRAQQVQAHVATYADGDYRQVFAVENGHHAGKRVPIEVTEELDLGSERVLLLAPEVEFLGHFDGPPLACVGSVLHGEHLP